MPRLGLAGDTGFNRHRRDGTRQVWGGHTHVQPVSNLVAEVLDQPLYNCNPDPSKRGRVYGPKGIHDIMRAHPMHNQQEYRAFRTSKLNQSRPLLWARGSNGNRCTFETRPDALGWPAVDAKQAEEACRYYPHQPDIIMKTIMNFADGFEPKQLNKDSAMFRAMGVKEIAENILDRMSLLNRAQFSRTCSDAMIVTGSFQVLYDLSRQDFKCSEFTEKELANMKQQGTMSEDQQQRGTKYLLVSQTHLEYLRDHSDVRDPNHPEGLIWAGYRRLASYCALAEAVGRLTRSFFLRGCNIEHLTLHRVPFANGKVIAGWMVHMPKLQRLEIVGCEMFRFHEMAPFYRDVAKIQGHHGTKIQIEISPLRETGTRWENRNDTFPIHDSRLGEYVVCWTDVGVKIPTAVAVELYWQLFPAMSEAGQFETIFDLTSATRQYLELLPMPKMAIPILITIFSEYMDLQVEIEEAEAEWIDEHPAPPPVPVGGNNAANGQANRPRRRRNREAEATPNPCPGLYDPHHWQPALRRKVANFMVKRDHALAFAMFGKERWIETSDRSEMSTNTQCRTDNYGLWGADKLCVQCKTHMPLIAFTGGGHCENCRLKNACEDETDHFKQLKKKATEALGFGVQPAQVGNQAPHADDEQRLIGVTDISQSNFPTSEAFWETDDDGNRAGPITRPGDLAFLMSNPEGPLPGFFFRALQMDNEQARYGPIGHIGFRQKKHPSGEYLQPDQSVWQMVGHYLYRQCLSVEDFTKTPEGMTPKDVLRFRGQF